mmetsp:Transcript_44026/g.141993  ORF Transcript_44026/g.141993 Transcript_44026/m.141993 type:complete len:275 (-) Transcript_44026:395-1219(-)
MSSECSEAEALESGVRGRGGPALPCRDIPLHLPMMDHGAPLLRACDTLDRATGRARSHRAAASRRARATSAEGGDPRLGRLGLRESDRRGSVVEPRALRGASAVPALPGRLRRRSGGRAAGRRHDDIREGEVERAGEQELAQRRAHRAEAIPAGAGARVSRHVQLLDHEERPQRRGATQHPPSLLPLAAPAEGGEAALELREHDREVDSPHVRRVMRHEVLQHDPVQADAGAEVAQPAERRVELLHRRRQQGVRRGCLAQCQVEHGPAGRRVGE